MPDNFGPCCCCGQDDGVRNIIMIEKLAPIPGHGWGCSMCRLGSDGAIYVCCDDCLERDVLPKWACRGYPGSEGRIPIGELTGEFKHDMAFHPGEQALTSEGK